MYEDFYQLTAEPFRLSPDHRFCFPHGSYAKAKAYMEYALHQAEGFVMITGKPGTGKTTLIHDLINDLPQARVKVAMLMITQLEADDLLRTVAFSFGLAAESSDKATIIEEIAIFLTRQHREGRRALLIVDEAQNLSVSAMEELRLLTNLQSNNRPLLQIFLLGQEELRDLMQGPKMVQGHQRIVAAAHLKPLIEEEVADYVRHRLSRAGWNESPRLSTTIFPIIHQFSRGIPRTINLICSRLFLNAFVEQQQQIGMETLKTVLGELQQEQLLPAYPELEMDALFNQVDDYASEIEQSLDSEPEAKNTPAPIYDLEAHRARENPVHTLKPTEYLEPEPPEPELLEPEPGEPEPAEPEPAEPEPAEPEPAEPESAQPESAEPAELVEPVEVSHVLSVVATDRASTKGNGRYWLIALSLAGLLAVGGVSYVKYGASFDFAPLIQQAQQLKTKILSSFAPPQPALANNQDQKVEMTSEKETQSIGPAKHVANTETTDDLVGIITPIFDEAAWTTIDAAVDDQVLETSSVVSSETLPTKANPENKPQPVTVPARQILFPYKSMEIPPQFKELLNEVADELEEDENTVLQIVGIVDNRGQASPEYKRHISMQRATEVSRYLNDRGIAAERLRIEEDAGPQDTDRERGENETSPRPQRLVEVTVLIPTD